MWWNKGDKIMLLIGFTMNQYIICFIATFFLIIIDSIFTNINAQMYKNYYLVEMIPWYRIIYKYVPGVGALVLSLVCSVGIYFGLMMLPISITNFLIILGMFIYRTIHSGYRVIYNWRMYHGKQN